VLTGSININKHWNTQSLQVDVWRAAACKLLLMVVKMHSLMPLPLLLLHYLPQPHPPYHLLPHSQPRSLDAAALPQPPPLLQPLLLLLHSSCWAGHLAVCLLLLRG
jgi:hypothetical protein